MVDTLNVVKANVSDLTPDPRNANKGTQRGRGMLDKSLRQYGAGRSILLDKNNRIIAGNKTTEAAADIGLNDVVIVESDGTQLVAVKRTDLDLDDNAARELAYADNRVAQVDLDWDATQMLQDAAAGVDLDKFFMKNELDEMLGRAVENDSARPAGAIFTNEQIIDSAFTYFRAAGFPYRKLPIHVCMQEINKLARTETDKLIGTNTGYHVADAYYPHRFHASAEGMKSPFDAFSDDTLLRRALANELSDGDRTVPETYFTSLNMVSGTQSTSNFRPGFALYLYRRFAQSGAVVLDTSTGYGGRLVGFMASGLDRYIGIDPNIPTHEGNTRMTHDLGFSDRVELYNLPAEDVSHDALIGRCDFAFTSPPYFSKEHYSDDDTQSWVRYKTGEDWRISFLLPMMRLQYAALKEDSFAIVNIADVKLRNKVYPLVEWTIAAGKESGFDFINQERFELTRRFGAGMSDEVSFEPVLIFRKP